MKKNLFVSILPFAEEEAVGNLLQRLDGVPPARREVEQRPPTAAASVRLGDHKRTEETKMPDPTAVTALVRALIEAEVPELPPGDERALRLLRYALRILGSSMPSALPSASQSAELARRRLVHAGRTEDALALSRRLRALEACPGARNLPCVLHLLTCLMQSPPPGSLAAFARGSLLERTGGRAIESGGASRPSRAAVPLPSRRAPSCSDGIGRADASALQHAAAAAAASGGAAATSASAAPARTGWRAGAGSGGVVGEEASETLPRRFRGTSPPRPPQTPPVQGARPRPALRDAKHRGQAPQVGRQGRLLPLSARRATTRRPPLAAADARRRRRRRFAGPGSRAGGGEVV